MMTFGKSSRHVKLANWLWGVIVANSWWLWVVLLLIGLSLMAASSIVLLLSLKRENKEAQSIETLLQTIAKNTSHAYSLAPTAEVQSEHEKQVAKANTKETGEDSTKSRANGE
jgi:biopolymer transport protein ExbB/TolQ